MSCLGPSRASVKWGPIRPPFPVNWKCPFMPSLKGLMKFFGEIPKMILHQFKIILNFGMSLSLLVGLLPYLNYTNIGISPVLDEISFRSFMETFLRCSCTTFNYSKCLVCLSVCQLAYFLTNNRKIIRYLKFWLRYLYRFLLDIPRRLVPQLQIYLNSLYVPQSVSWLTSLLELHKYSDISSSG